VATLCDDGAGVAKSFVEMFAIAENDAR
jgi:hypothetical protein